MQTANILVALGGDTGNTVPKYDATPAEVAVLRVIHGDDAVFNIEPGEDVERTSRAERQRLIDIYALVQPDGVLRSPAVDSLFPGVAARVFEDFDELELPEEYYKAEKRVSSRTKAAPAKKAKSKKAAASESGEAAADEPIDEEEDGIGEIDDEHSEAGKSLFK